MVFLVAWRNFCSNRKNSIIITALLTLIITLFYLGNTFIYNSAENLYKTYVLNYTGDFVIQAQTDSALSLFGVNNPAIGEFFTIPPLLDYKAIIELLRQFPEIENYTSQVSGPLALDVFGKRYPVFAFGIEPETYYKVFPSLKVVLGEKILSQRYGVMLSRDFVSQIESDTGQALKANEPLLFTTAGASGFKIREIPLVGIYEYEIKSELPTQLVFIDVQNLRALNSILLASPQITEIEADKSDILTDDIDSIFSQEKPTEISEEDNAISLQELNKTLKQESEFEGDWKEGSWNFIILRLKKGVNQSAFLSKLNDRLKPFSAQAVDWTVAAGLPAMLVTILYYLFNSALIFLVSAGIFAIINVMLISVFQRVREIGTLRAIGASNWYIRLLLILESIYTALGAGILGTSLGSIIIWLLNKTQLKISNNLLISLLGQEIIQFGFSAHILFLSLVLALCLGLISSIYPVSYALRIQPIEAVREG